MLLITALRYTVVKGFQWSGFSLWSEILYHTTSVLSFLPIFRFSLEVKENDIRQCSPKLLLYRCWIKWGGGPLVVPIQLAMHFLFLCLKKVDSGKCWVIFFLRGQKGHISIGISDLWHKVKDLFQVNRDLQKLYYLVINNKNWVFCFLWYSTKATKTLALKGNRKAQYSLFLYRIHCVTFYLLIYTKAVIFKEKLLGNDSPQKLWSHSSGRLK